MGSGRKVFIKCGWRRRIGWSPSLLADAGGLGLVSPVQIAISFWSSQLQETGEGAQVVGEGPFCDVSAKMEKGRGGA